MDSVKKSLDVIHTKADQLEGMINELINYVKLNNTDWRETLREEGCNAETPAMKAIGYREFFDSELNGDIGLIKAAIKHNSHRYAKRQITYMQNIPEAITLHADSMEKIRGLAEDFFSKWLDGES